MYEWIREFIILGSIDIAHDLTHHAPYYGLAMVGGWFCRGCIQKIRERAAIKRSS